jgi:hypothetical protein
MFLEILLPESRDGHRNVDESDDEQSTGQESSEWSTQIELFFPALGELRVSLSRSAAGLKLGLAAEAGSADILRADTQTLLERLRALGFDSPSLDIALLDGE